MTDDTEPKPCPKDSATLNVEAVAALDHCDLGPFIELIESGAPVEPWVLTAIASRMRGDTEDETLITIRHRGRAHPKWKSSPDYVAKEDGWDFLWLGLAVYWYRRMKSMSAKEAERRVSADRKAGINRVERAYSLAQNLCRAGVISIGRDEYKRVYAEFCDEPGSRIFIDGPHEENGGGKQATEDKQSNDK